MRLVYQDIKHRCTQQMPPMLTPYQPDKVVINGKSGGASGSSYDLHIAQDVTLGINPGEIVARAVKALPLRSSPFRFMLAYARLRKALIANPPMRSLASTLEDFNLPDDVTGEIKDKSTNARLYMSMFTTFFDAGFTGNGTLELVNHGDQPFVAKAGDPICQMVFTQCAQPTERPYRANGKYTGQQGPTPAILEQVSS